MKSHYKTGIRSIETMLSMFINERSREITPRLLVGKSVYSLTENKGETS